MKEKRRGEGWRERERGGGGGGGRGGGERESDESRVRKGRVLTRRYSMISCESRNNMMKFGSKL